MDWQQNFKWTKVFESTNWKSEPLTLSYAFRFVWLETPKLCSVVSNLHAQFWIIVASRKMISWFWKIHHTNDQNPYFRVKTFSDIYLGLISYYKWFIKIISFCAQHAYFVGSYWQPLPCTTTWCRVISWDGVPWVPNFDRVTDTEYTYLSCHTFEL